MTRFVPDQGKRIQQKQMTGGSSSDGDLIR